MVRFPAAHSLFPPNGKPGIACPAYALVFIPAAAYTYTMEDPVVFFHGFSEKELFAMIDALKKAASAAGLDAASIAFAASTPSDR
jgi:hypothetical protein